MDDKKDEIRKIRVELQWLAWGLVKVPLIALGLFLVYSLVSRPGGEGGENGPTGPADSLERVCTETEDGRLAIEVGQRTVFLDKVPFYENLSAEQKWKFWDADQSGEATEKEIEAGILRLKEQPDE